MTLVRLLPPGSMLVSIEQHAAWDRCRGVKDDFPGKLLPPSALQRLLITRSPLDSTWRTAATCRLLCRLMLAAGRRDRPAPAGSSPPVSLRHLNLGHDLCKVTCREHAPSIIFMDEVDSIGSAREGSGGGGGGGDSEVQRTMLELLNQLDGFEATNQIKVRICVLLGQVESQVWGAVLLLPWLSMLTASAWLANLPPAAPKLFEGGRWRGLAKPNAGTCRSSFLTEAIVLPAGVLSADCS